MQSPESWIDYWKRDTLWSQSRLWEVNSRIYVKRLLKIIPLSTEAEVLNVGCGMGYADEVLAGKVKRWVAVDSAEQFVQITKRKVRGFSSAQVLILKNPYVDLSPFGKFSLILCNSVVQYYEGLHELGALIHSASQVVLPGGSLLISDIPLKRKGIEPFWDKIEMVLKSIAGGYFFEILQVFKKSRKEKQYAEISKRKPSLEFDFLELREFVSALGFRAEWIRKDFSIYPNRVSLRVQF